MAALRELTPEDWAALELLSANVTRNLAARKAENLPGYGTVILPEPLFTRICAELYLHCGSFCIDVNDTKEIAERASYYSKKG